MSVLLCNWSHVLNYVNKAEASPELVSEVGIGSILGSLYVVWLHFTLGFVEFL